jgi:hypothetical protein
LDMRNCVATYIKYMRHTGYGGPPETIEPLSEISDVLDLSSYLYFEYTVCVPDIVRRTGFPRPVCTKKARQLTTVYI